jgi:hypothetical protein
MGTLTTKGRCPKCGGSLYLEKDYNGWYEECLQCGHTKDLAVVYQRQKKTEKVGSDIKKQDATPGK